MRELSKHLEYFACLILIFYAANAKCLSKSKTQQNDSDELKILQKMMDSDEFDKVLTRSQSILLNVGQKNELYSIASYYAGIASYHKKNYLQSSRYLLNYKSNEGISSLDEVATFYWGLNLVQLGYKLPAIHALRQFEKKYKNSYFYPEAVYQIALINFECNSLSQSIEDLNKLNSFNLEKDLKIRIHLLKGKIFIELSRYAEAEAEFLNAKNLADNDGCIYRHEAMSLLIKAAGQQYRWSDSVFYYNQIQGSNLSQIQRIDAAAYVMSSMEQMDKLDQGIIDLEKNLLGCRDFYLYDSCYEAINVYVNFQLKEKTPREVINKLRNLISESSDRKSVIELWAIAGLEVLEKFNPKNSSEIRVYYKNLVDRFKVNEFSNRSLIKIADHFLESNPQISINCYKEIKNRGASLYLLTAMLRLYRLYNDQGIEESVEITENELKHVAIIYGENFFNSITKADKVLFDQIMDSKSGMIIDLNAMNELVCSSISPKRSALRKITKRK